MAAKSSFYHDGYRDAATDARPNPPNPHNETDVYAAEYWAGWRDAIEDDETMKPVGTNDINADFYSS
jgi:ribosome modulation factor